jgi:hypothetical protein
MTEPLGGTLEDILQPATLLPCRKTMGSPSPTST